VKAAEDDLLSWILIFACALFLPYFSSNSSLRSRFPRGSGGREQTVPPEQGYLLYHLLLEAEESINEILI